VGEVFTGNQVRLAIWHETTWASETPTAAFEIPISMDNVTAGETQEVIESMEPRGSRKEAEPYLGLIKAESISLPVIAKYRSIWHIVKQVLGAITTSGTGPAYNQEATIGAALPGFGFELAIVDPVTPANSKVWRAYGCRLQEVSFPIAKPSGEMIWTCRAVAAKVDGPLTQAPITAATFDESPILFADQSALTLDSGGGATDLVDVLEATLTMSLTVQGYPTARNSGRVGLISSGTTKVRGQLKSLFHDAVVYDSLATARTPFSLVSTFTKGTDVFSLQLLNAILDKGPLSVSGAQGIPLDRNFGAYEDTTDPDSPLKVTGANGETSY
jgi:hypothetical protein